MVPWCAPRTERPRPTVETVRVRQLEVVGVTADRYGWWWGWLVEGVAAGSQAARCRRLLVPVCRCPRSSSDVSHASVGSVRYASEFLWDKRTAAAILRFSALCVSPLRTVLPEFRFYCCSGKEKLRKSKIIPWLTFMYQLAACL